MAKTTKAKGKTRELNSDQKLFCEMHLATHPRNATRVYMHVYGVTNEKAANAAASRLLANVKVQEYIAKREKELFKGRYAITQERIAAEIAAIAFTRKSDFYDIIDGQEVLKPVDQIPEEAWAAVIGVTRTDLAGVKKFEYRLADKLKALELLGRHKRMFNDQSTVTLEAGDTLKAFLEGVSGKTLGPPGLRKQ